MTASGSRFGRLAQAVREGTAASAPVSPERPEGAALHKPAAALGAMGEAVRDRLARLEAELAAAGSANAELVEELRRTRALSMQAGDAIDEFIFLEPAGIIDRLPQDRLRGGFEGREFEDLLQDIETNGQNDAITVRRMPAGGFEVAAGRRRLEACQRLQRSVLARVRALDDQAMLRVQFSENERRADISALERARWFSQVRDRLQRPAKEIAGQFGIDPSTFSLYLRLARFPVELLERLREPRRLAVLPARRIMEAIEADPDALPRIRQALESHERVVARAGLDQDPASQIEVMLRAAEGRGNAGGSHRASLPERRHIVHQGRRIGTLTRNGGQWIFRFATSVPEDDVHRLAERLAEPLPKGGAGPAGAGQGKPPEDQEA